MRNLAAVVLAAGKGTRMKSDMPKVLHRVAGHPMLFYPVRLLKKMKVGRVLVVIGHGADDVKKTFQAEGLVFVEQSEQLGTGHAVMCALKELKGFDGDVLILSGDVPLIREETLAALIGLHRAGRKKAALSLVTTVMDDPNGYGRIIRDDSGRITRIVEDKDCSPLQKRITEVNSGIYLAGAGFLHENIRRIGKENAQGEYYLPDLVHLAASEGGRVESLKADEPQEVMGINNRVELARSDKHLRLRVAEALMLSGVTIVDPEATYIEYGAAVGIDTVIYPGARISGNSVIGANCLIEEGSRIESSRIGDRSTVKSYSVIEDSKVGQEVSIGPFAHLRPGNTIGDKARIGNFVEVKKSVVGKGSKANHLTYLGDSFIGEGVNIGAGTITCNYDGVKKYQTTIEDGAFIGSDSQLVAPVRVGKGAYVGSGTTVTKDVPPGALVITRAPEKVVEGWVARKLKGKEKD
ncbi:MAG TPA: bifunctional UDP-N-acetylglucosamine diphosphorylase/glucosamine-1-phosphate N-acetyltransferase GlmU [Deltaproteobacteria bacterium]|nr:MAG: UDP-N-acetylglucosamine diphosphorylase/glucosamine-1-phosphate N-acetyltransferase [Deltaproteobacteria bacterium GWA2_55_82]OIJ74536.1 MAG: UDP-N-acetylglucosamine diphosphorylase/glucosamine-1-phosphate N-acetyltransferase [Deltaproteobacteria bacterium GWC2_55_46]HBG47200.1 bifunctional UDP-N-acetylglucosamine diphosphorylase/glucosamine-1-phosphate N-acetyltransferase GlmU [Deltaproteobacteria bacterium]HCY10738.1 bifunctional UDP-N-acetylglucosamine diphosphorylase/glucosamine-1-ph